MRWTASAAAAVALVAGLPTLATAQVTPAAGAGEASHATGTVHTDSAASRCLIWRRTSDNYEGLTAGYSWAWNVVVGPGDSGDRVREIQCLTDFWVGEPSVLDGDYGPATEQAVRDAQAALPGCAADGVVGPDTWRCLRDGGQRR
ncbi:peptidoglycan-binding protein [Streptomyces sp. NPDC059215]|uniref:peptidoglycan-binding domain-containing protein n=1 Tax=Streptomyces sp. NPDC059215 TaxID=3346772 RepID=UPI0036A4C2FD